MVNLYEDQVSEMGGRLEKPNLYMHFSISSISQAYLCVLYQSWLCLSCSELTHTISVSLLFEVLFEFDGFEGEVGVGLRLSLLCDIQVQLSIFNKVSFFSSVERATVVKGMIHQIQYES